MFSMYKLSFMMLVCDCKYILPAGFGTVLAIWFMLQEKEVA